MHRRFAHAAFAALRDHGGATAVEYGLLLGGIAVAIIVAVFAVGGEVTGFFDAAKDFSQPPG